MKTKTLTVGGVTFTADQIERAILKIEGRTIKIGKKGESARVVGFGGHDSKE